MSRAIQDKNDRADVLSDLAIINCDYLSEALDVLQLINKKSYSWYEHVIEKLVENISENHLPELYPAINQIIHGKGSRMTINSYLSRLRLAQFPYSRWCEHLHFLAHRTRADLMGNLATLYPAILHLGGEEAGRGMVGEMGRVCRQWK